MKKPDFRDAVYESFFSGGYTSAVASGALDKDLYDKHEAFFRSMDQGAPLVAWCHFVDTYFGDREKLIDNLDDNNLEPVVRLLFYVRNAFVHCAWDVSKLDSPTQQKKIRGFYESGGTYAAVRYGRACRRAPRKAACQHALLSGSETAPSGTP